MEKINKLIKTLIKIPSISGNEKEISNWIMNHLEKKGFQAKQHDNRNISLLVKGKNRKKLLIFNAHMDTVQAGDLKKWKTDPYKSRFVGNKCFGLGASDEKAGIASLLLLADMLKKNKPHCDIILTFVVKEEVDGSGTRNFVQWLIKEKSCNRYEKKACILVEPTGLKSIEIGHKGNVFLKLTVNGDSGHGSKPEDIKINSVLTMSKILIHLKSLPKKWSKKYSDKILGSPTIGIGTSIKAGSQKNPNKFADVCVATLDVRTNPKIHSKVLWLIKDYLKNFPVKVEYLYSPAPFGYIEKENALVKSISDVIPNLDMEISKGSTDQCFFSEKNIPAVIFGPGEKNYIHKENEYCFVSKIKRSVSLYIDIIKKWTEMT